MDWLKVNIVQFVLEHQPNVVRCEFVDAGGRAHSFIDKVPIFSHEYLDAQSRYPQPGELRCEILDIWREADRELARITTDRPDALESTEGLSEFTVLASEISRSVPADS